MKTICVVALACSSVLLASMQDAQAASLRQLVEVVDISMLSASPDGRLVTFRTEQASIDRNTYDTVWYVQPIDGSTPPRRLGEAGPPQRDAGGMSLEDRARWSRDGAWIFYRAVLDGRVDVWRAAADGSRTERVTRDPANVRNFAPSADGAALYYSVGGTREDVVEAELDEYDRGVRIDRSVPLGDNLFRSGYHEGRLATQRLVDNELVRFPLLSTAPDRWKSIDLGTGKVSALSAEWVPADPSMSNGLDPGFGDVLNLAKESEHGRIAFLVRYKDPGESSSWSIRLAVLAGKKARDKPVQCAAEACTGKKITSLVWRPGSDEVIFTVTDDAYGQSLFGWNVVSGDVRRLAGSSGHLGGGERWRPGPCSAVHDALVCVSAKADRPPRLERIDLESGEHRVLYEPNMTLARDLADSVEVRRLVWTDALDRRYTGQFYPAASNGDVPPPLVIVYYQCAGFLRGGVGDEWPLATLARRGIAALCVNAAPLQDDAVERFDQGRAAIESVVEHLSSLGEIDAANVGIGGLSFGAEVALWTAMNSSVARAVSVSTPVTSPNLTLLLSLWGDTYQSRLQRYWQLGTIEETSERWRQISPAFEPGRIRVPVLMQMSEQEYRSSLDYAVPLIRMGRADVYAFPHEPHQKYLPRHKLAVYERNLDWFHFWLQSAEDTQPTKHEQYRHWRRMKESLAPDRDNQH